MVPGTKVEISKFWTIVLVTKAKNKSYKIQN